MHTFLLYCATVPHHGYLSTDTNPFHRVLVCLSLYIQFYLQIKQAAFKPDRSRWIFQGEKILSTPSFGGEVKPSVPCRRFTACKRSLNVTWKLGIFRQNSSAISRPCSSTFGCWISWRRLVAKVGTFEKKKVHKHLHLWRLGPHRRRLSVRSGTSKGSTISQYGCSTFGALATEAQ